MYSNSKYIRRDYDEFQKRKLAKDAKKNPKAFYGYMKKKTGNRVSVGRPMETPWIHRYIRRPPACSPLARGPIGQI